MPNRFVSLSSTHKSFFLLISFAITLFIFNNLILPNKIWLPCGIGSSDTYEVQILKNLENFINTTDRTEFPRADLYQKVKTDMHQLDNQKKDVHEEKTKQKDPHQEETQKTDLHQADTQKNDKHQADTQKKKIQNLPTLYIITPTYERREQIPELTRLSQTLMHVPDIVWMVIEDATELSPKVLSVLLRSGLRFVHLVAPMPKKEKQKPIKARGVSNRNKGLEWIRNKKNDVDESGIVYFADDDNTYDLRLFEEIRTVKNVGMWPVGLVKKLGFSSPIVKDGKVVGFYDGFKGRRKFMVDMAGFAVSVRMVLDNSNATMPFVVGYEEDGILKSLGVSMEMIEPKANNCTEIYVWHTQTNKNPSPAEVSKTLYPDAIRSNIMKLYKQVTT